MTSGVVCESAAKIPPLWNQRTPPAKISCQSKSPEKTLDVARVSRVGEEVHLVFEARSFLHRQVRSMAGTLAEVGLGRWSAEDVRDALEARDRQACGPVAPSDGLYLTGVSYD